MKMTRKEAIEKGETQYHGKPCKTCGDTLKYVSGYNCVACITQRTKDRDPEVYKRYIKSEKGQKWLKEFRRSETWHGVQNRYHRKRYSYNPEWYQSRNLKKNYGISLEEYQDMLKQQDGVCYICKEEPGQRNLAVDHNHETGDNRKLLCNKCNTALGLLNEDTYIMKSMIDYVEAHS